ncbi:HIRAN domain-containing protein [Agromyces laixinhei]|uniref:HIRAN domain-containing protein n=1 Tax=Agromyces laixinhei TaxID=2585717 RepID=UPI00111696C0|nr:HIRAN domain-containing protein [Agromyces laixinhei]
MAGFLSRLFGGGSGQARTTETQPAQSASSVVAREVPIGRGWNDIEVAGEAYYRGGLANIFGSLGRLEGGVTMQVAQLIPEPTNKYDPNAVRVVVNGHQVGHVPQEDSRNVARACSSVGRGGIAVVPARIWARNDDNVWRGRVTLMFSGDSESEKDYAAERLASEAYESARLVEQMRKAEAKAAREAEKEARRTAGAVDGEYWALLKPSIAELKRQQRFDEARDLLVKCRDAAEREAASMGEIPNPWATEQLSVVLRRLREFPQELEALERYVAACGDREIPDSVSSRISRSRITAERGA